MLEESEKYFRDYIRHHHKITGYLDNMYILGIDPYEKELKNYQLLLTI